MEVSLENIRIVLVEPAGARNVGAIARVMKNMGLHQLVLVNPQCDWLGDEALHMAVHAPEILEHVTIAPSLPAALVGCQRAIATTGLVRSLPVPFEPPRTALPWLMHDHNPAALIFGREDRGLDNAELSYAQRVISIPAHPAYPSLNLAQAVGICCYELYQWAIAGNSAPQPPNPSISGANTVSPPASVDTLEAFYQHLEAVLLQIGYLYPHTATSRMQKFRYLFNRALPSEVEITMFRGVLSQVEWASRQSKSTTSSNPLGD